MNFSCVRDVLLKSTSASKRTRSNLQYRSKKSSRKHRKTSRKISRKKCPRSHKKCPKSHKKCPKSRKKCCKCHKKKALKNQKPFPIKNSLFRSQGTNNKSHG